MNDADFFWLANQAGLTLEQAEKMRDYGQACYRAGRQDERERSVAAIGALANQSRNIEAKDAIGLCCDASMRGNDDLPAGQSYWQVGFDHGKAGLPPTPPNKSGIYDRQNHGYDNGYEAGRLAAIRATNPDQSGKV